MDLQLRGRRTLITGSTAGIGFAIACALAQEGAFAVINGRTEARVTAAVKRLQNLFPEARVSGIAGDLSDPAAAQEVLRQMPEVDVLVNNLGIYQAKPFVELADTDWLTLFNTNVMSGVRLSRHYLPLMMKKDSGRIIFISSESALNIPAEMIHYGMTKTAQLAVARGLAELTAGTRVTVNSILAGPTRSEGVEKFIEELAAQQNSSAARIEQDFFQNVRPASLLRRFIEPEEIARLVVFLASPLSSAINGAALRADGGLLRSAV
jgi:NAD(P)-dependent dehydrogenase (short-subunit alcohol dehydrogenase family)